MMSPKKILEDIKQNNNQLFRSFLPSSDTNFNEFKNFKKFKTVIIIGMGGSILSSKAVYSFLKHKIKKDFVFIDNLDQSFLEKVKKKYNFSKTSTYQKDTFTTEQTDNIYQLSQKPLDSTSSRAVLFRAPSKTSARRRNIDI